MLQFAGESLYLRPRALRQMLPMIDIHCPCTADAAPSDAIACYGRVEGGIGDMGVETFTWQRVLSCLFLRAEYLRLYAAREPHLANELTAWPGS